MSNPGNHPDPVIRHDVGGWISGPCEPEPHGMSAADASALFNLRLAWEDR